MRRLATFQARERATQILFRSRSDTFSDEGRVSGTYRGKQYDFLLPEGLWRQNLQPALRDQAEQYFADKRIVWHRMRHHLLSSQVCCLNFLMPFVTRPDALADLLSTVIGPATMRPVEWDPAGRPLYVAFEYISPRDHFNEGEGRSRRRGANCTSADAAVKFERNGRVEMLLIEWKYTESYGSHQLSGGEGAFQKRLSRYAHLAFHTNGGPIKSDTGIEFSDFFHEPFYQFARQQIMADQMKKAGDADCVRVLHVAPAANGAFERVTAPRLGRGERKATEVWKGMLVDPSTFISIATEELFGRFNASRHIDLAGWWHYVRMRYPTLTAA